MFYLFRWPTGTCSGINGILWLLKKKKKNQYYGLKKWIWKSWWYYSWALYIMSNISMFVSLNQVYCHLVDFNGLFNISLLLKIKYPALEEFKCVENSYLFLIVHPRKRRLSWSVYFCKLFLRETCLNQYWGVILIFNMSLCACVCC